MWPYNGNSDWLSSEKDAYDTCILYKIGVRIEIGLCFTSHADTPSHNSGAAGNL